jgi:hypothetical protein
LYRRIAIDIDVLADVNSERENNESAGGWWAGAEEREPRIVSRLAQIAAARQWEILFLTNVRPSRDTAQADAQRWLESKGFVLPAVFVAPGPRGLIAAALHLDIVIDGTIERCADVAEQSRARAILVSRAESAGPQEAGRRVAIAKSFGECLDQLAAEDHPSHKAGWLSWARRLIGSAEDRP